MPTQDDDFDVLIDSWQLAMRADGYSAATLTSYAYALTSLRGWLAAEHPDVGPLDLERRHVRGWMAALLETQSRNGARSWLSGVRHFCRWLVAEGELTEDASLGVRMPPPGTPRTPILKLDEQRALLATCGGRDFVDRRDKAIIGLMLDTGPRLAEVGGLALAAVDVRDRVVMYEGKGSMRSGPKIRAVSFGVRTAQDLDRYLRDRRRHPFADAPAMWLGDRGRGPISPPAIKAMLERRAARAGIEHLHPHMARHTWAHFFRLHGGEEGDLKYLGGWRSRQMLDRYGESAEGVRAMEAARRHSLRDRL